MSDALDAARSISPRRALQFGHQVHQRPGGNNFTLVSVENVPVVLAVLDKGHQSKLTRAELNSKPLWPSIQLPAAITAPDPADRRQRRRYKSELRSPHQAVDRDPGRQRRYRRELLLYVRRARQRAHPGLHIPACGLRSSPRGDEHQQRQYQHHLHLRSQRQPGHRPRPEHQGEARPLAGNGLPSMRKSTDPTLVASSGKRKTRPSKFSIALPGRSQSTSRNSLCSQPKGPCHQSR
jgi:hypothetical protein